MASMELEITVHSAMELKNVNWPNGGLLPYTKVFLNRVETGRYSDTKSTGTDFSGSTIPVWNKTLVFRIKEYHIPSLAANFRVSHLLPPGPRNPTAKAVVGSASLPLTHLFGSGGSSSSSNWFYGHGVDRNVQLFRPSGRPQGILFIKAVLVPCPQVVTSNMYDDSFSYFASELYRQGLYNMLKMNNPDSANTDSNTCYCMSCCQRHVAAEAAMRCGTMEEDQENAVNYMQNMYNPDFANDHDSYLASQQQQRRYDVQNTTNPDSSNNDDDFYLAQQHHWQYGARNVNNPDSAKNDDDFYFGSQQQRQYDVQNTMNPDSSNDYDFYLAQQQQRQYGADNVNNPDSANGGDDFYLDSRQQQQQRYDMQNMMNPDSSNNDYDIYLAQHQLWQYGVDNVNNSDSANDENDFHLDSQQQQYDVHNMDNLNSANSNHNNNNCYGMTRAPAEATMRYNSTLEEAEEDVVKYRQYSTEPTTEVATTSYSHYQEDEDSKLDVLTGAVADLSLKKKHEEEEEEEEDEEGEEKEEGVELKEKQKAEESAESSDMDREDYYSADEDSDDYVIV